MPSSELTGHHGPSRSICSLALLFLLLASQVCAREMKSFKHLDEQVEKLFCGRTGHICAHKRPSILHHRQSITGPRSPRSTHAESAKNVAFYVHSAAAAAQGETTKSDNTMMNG